MASPLKVGQGKVGQDYLGNPEVDLPVIKVVCVMEPGKIVAFMDA